MRFSCTNERQGSSAVIRLAGEIDLNTCDDLRTTVVEVLDAGARDVFLDFTDVTFFDSSGLGTLVAITKHADQTEANVVLCALSSRLVRILEITHLRDAFTILPDVPPPSAP
jgi:anti-sigma B factor antagonist